MRYCILPYKAGSQSAGLLKDELDGLKIRNSADSTYRPRADDVVLNWGSSTIRTPSLQNLNDLPAGARFFNRPQSVLEMGNKLSFFQTMNRTNVSNYIPAFYTSKRALLDTPFMDGQMVFGRRSLTGHGGHDIVKIVMGQIRAEDIPDLPLYTVYYKKTAEYRVHIVNSRPIVYQQKVFIRTPERPNPSDWQIRNHTHGHTFCIMNTDAVDGLPRVVRNAISAVAAAVLLDFYSVDIIYSNTSGHAFVLEVNTASGLSDLTVPAYAAAIRDMVENPRAVAPVAPAPAPVVVGQDVPIAPAAGVNWQAFGNPVRNVDLDLLNRWTVLNRDEDEREEIA